MNKTEFYTQLEENDLIVTVEDYETKKDKVFHLSFDSLKENNKHRLRGVENVVSAYEKNEDRWVHFNLNSIKSIEEDETEFGVLYG